MHPSRVVLLVAIGIVCGELVAPASARRQAGKHFKYQPCKVATCREGLKCREIDGKAKCFSDKGSSRCPDVLCSNGTIPYCDSDNEYFHGTPCQFAAKACRHNWNKTLVGQECPNRKAFHYNPCEIKGCWPGECRLFFGHARCFTKTGLSTCPDPHCPPVIDPVCASDGKTYLSTCAFMAEACRNEKRTTIVSKGYCANAPRRFVGRTNTWY